MQASALLLKQLLRAILWTKKHPTKGKKWAGRGCWPGADVSRTACCRAVCSFDGPNTEQDLPRRVPVKAALFVKQPDRPRCVSQW